jgi:hypothetical protein
VAFDYFSQLIQRAIEENKKAYIKLRHAFFYENLLTLDRMLLAVYFSNFVLNTLSPKHTKATDPWCDLRSDYYNEQTSLKYVFTSIDPERFKFTGSITDKMSRIVRTAAKLLCGRHGWRMFLRRGKNCTVVAIEEGKEFKIDDMVSIMIHLQ